MINVGEEGRTRQKSAGNELPPLPAAKAGFGFGKFSLVGVSSYTIPG